MTLNGEMALILLVFCFILPNLVVKFMGAMRKSGWQNHNYGQYTITMSTNYIYIGTARRPREIIFDNCKVEIL